MAIWVPASAQQAARYPADALLAAARDAGHIASRRLITDWVSIGLLDSPKARGRGRGKGKEYTWPYEQLQLFLATLDKRAEGAKRRALLNLPVTFWLICGDRYAPLRQVRRAMGSWAGAHRAVGVGIARRILKDTIAQLDHPNAQPEDRKRLKQTLSEVAWGQPLDRAELLERVTAVFDPAGSGLSRGPRGALTPQAFVDILEGRLLAVQALIDDTIPDETFEQARGAYLASGPMTPYMGEIAIQALSPDGQKAFEYSTNHACIHLLTTLGVDLLARERDNQRPPP